MSRPEGRALAKPRVDGGVARWYSLQEIAAFVGVSEDTVHRWIRTRNMPAHKVGRLWKFDVAEVNHWVKSGRARDEER